MEGLAPGLSVGEPDEATGINRFDNETDLIGMALNEKSRPRPLESRDDVSNWCRLDLGAKLGPSFPAPGQNRSSWPVGPGNSISSMSVSTKLFLSCFFPRFDHLIRSMSHTHFAITFG